jgi:hypothetical protein
LVYQYPLAARGPEGRTGQQRFDADRRTLEEAAERDAPGPRMLAHANTEDEGFILATTPATFRALTGAGEAEAAAPLPEVAPEDAAETRRAAATDLIRLLREADERAATWLAALRAETQQDPEAADDGLIPFTEEETALALFLLDDRSIQNLLRFFNLLVASARRFTAAESDESPEA